MKEVKVSELRQNLPQYLAQVGRGERLRVTSRGKAVAEIAPPSVSGQEIRAARKRLRGSVLRYERPLEPALGADEWEVNR